MPNEILENFIIEQLIRNGDTETINSILSLDGLAAQKDLLLIVHFAKNEAERDRASEHLLDSTQCATKDINYIIEHTRNSDIFQLAQKMLKQRTSKK